MELLAFLVFALCLMPYTIASSSPICDKTASHGRQMPLAEDCLVAASAFLIKHPDHSQTEEIPFRPRGYREAHETCYIVVLRTGTGSTTPTSSWDEILRQIMESLKICWLSNHGGSVASDITAGLRNEIGLTIGRASTGVGGIEGENGTAITTSVLPASSLVQKIAVS